MGLEDIFVKVSVNLTADMSEVSIDQTMSNLKDILYDIARKHNLCDEEGIMIDGVAIGYAFEDTAEGKDLIVAIYEPKGKKRTYLPETPELTPIYWESFK